MARDGRNAGAPRGTGALTVYPRLVVGGPAIRFQVQYDTSDVANLVVGIFEKGTDPSTVPSLGYFRDGGGNAVITNPLSSTAFSALGDALGSIATTSTADRAEVRRYLFAIVRNPTAEPAPITLNNFPAVSGAAPVHAYNVFAAAFDRFDNLIGYYEKDLSAGDLATGAVALPVELNRGGLATLTASASLRGTNLDPLENLGAVVVGIFDAHAYPRLGWITTDNSEVPFDGSQAWFSTLQKYLEAEAGVDPAITSDPRRYIIREFSSGLSTGDVVVEIANVPPGQHYRTFVMAVRNAVVNVGATVSAAFSVEGGGSSAFDAGVLTSGIVDTFAGTGTPGTSNAAGAVEFNAPQGLAFDSQGNLVIADTGNHQIRLLTTGGSGRTLAGAGAPGFQNGAGAQALFNSPCGVVVDGSGNVYVADRDNHLIRKIAPDGNVFTLAGTEGASGSADGRPGTGTFTYPTGVALDATGNLYVADFGNNRIRKVNPATGEITTLAGDGNAGLVDGPSSRASFNGPYALAVDPGGAVFVSDRSNHAIRKIAPDLVVSTIVGDGTAGSNDGIGTAARLSQPGGIALDAAGNLYIADTGNHRVRKLTPTLLLTTTLAGTAGIGFLDGSPIDARFNLPGGVAVAADGNLFVVDQNNHRIRRLR